MTAGSHPGKSNANQRTLGTVVLLSALYILVCLIWGTNWFAIKIAVADMPPMLSSGLRFLVAAPVLFALCYAFGAPLRFPRHLLWFGVLVTFGYFVAPFLLFNIAELHISSGMTAICFSTVSVLIVVLSVPILRTRLRAGQVIGVVIAFGALVLLVTGAQEVTADSAWGVVAALGAAGMHSLSYVLIKKHGGPVHTLTLNAVPVAVAGTLLVAASIAVERPGPDALTTSSVLATIHLGVVASVIGLVVYFWLLQRLSAITMSFVFVIFPLFAQLISGTLEGTELTFVDYLLTVVVISGFAVTQLSQRKTSIGAGGPDTPGPEESPTEEQIRQVYRHAARSYPHECCGFITRTGVYECGNGIDEAENTGGPEVLRDSATGYRFLPADLLKLNRSFDSEDPALFIYHSHPDVGAYFSAEDQRFAVVDGTPVYPVRHIVIDAAHGEVRGARIFGFSEAEGEYAEIGILGNPLPKQENPVIGAARGAAEGRPESGGDD